MLRRNRHTRFVRSGNQKLLSKFQGSPTFICCYTKKLQLLRHVLDCLCGCGLPKLASNQIDFSSVSCYQEIKSDCEISSHLSRRPPVNGTKKSNNTQLLSSDLLSFPRVGRTLVIKLSNIHSFPLLTFASMQLRCSIYTTLTLWNPSTLNVQQKIKKMEYKCLL